MAYTVVTGWNDVSYAGPLSPAHPVLRLRLFRPDWRDGAQQSTPVKPADGWPCVVYFPLKGFFQTWTLSSITGAEVDADEFLEDFLTAGYAVVIATLPPVRGCATVCSLTSSGSFDLSQSPALLGAAYEGNGTTAPPGATSYPGYAGTGSAPYPQPARLNAFQASVMLAQYMWGAAPSMLVDRTRMAVHGESAGAIAASWVTTGKDLAAATFPLAANDTQEARDTRKAFRAGVFRDWAGHPPINDEAVFNGRRFALLPSAGGAVDYGTSCATLSQTSTEFLTLVSALSGYQRRYRVPHYMMIREAAIEGYPWTARDGNETGTHSPWSAYALRPLFTGKGKVRLVATAQVAVDAGAVGTTDPSQVVTPDETIIGDGAALRVSMLAWLAKELAVMTLIVEDGTGKVDAESFASLATLEDYAEDFGLDSDAFVDASNAEKEAALRLATRYVESRFAGRFPGQKAAATQALSWPRAFAEDAEGHTIDDDVLPASIAKATCRAAVMHLDGETLFATDTAALRSESVSVGPISESKSYAGASDSRAFPAVRAELVNYLVPAGRVLRA